MLYSFNKINKISVGNNITEKASNGNVSSSDNMNSCQIPATALRSVSISEARLQKSEVINALPKKKIEPKTAAPEAKTPPI